MNDFISLEDIAEYSGSFRESRSNAIAMNAVTANGLHTAAKNRRAAMKVNHQYAIRLDQRGITNQKSSGRCWMFAALNCMRFQVIRNLNLEQFELSQNYTLFYDKLEKANYFLENILATLDEPVGSRIVDHLLKGPQQDGGQWDMISSIVSKYGVVPKYAMPETECSSSTKEMNNIVTGKLREDACRLRGEYEQGKTMEELRDIKKGQLQEIYRMLCICLGEPPKTFDFEVRSKNGEYIADFGITPLAFFEKYVNLDLGQYVSLINAPTVDKPYMRSYTVKYLGNVVGGKAIRYVNVPIEALKQAAIAQMKDGEPVWFGCDVGKCSDRPGGVMDLETYDFAALFDVKFGFTKAERLDYGHSKMSHAMVFQGVDLDQDGKPLRWCVENSWGEDKGDKGMYLMTDSWFDEYMYQVVVNRKYLSEEIQGAYDSEPIELLPWDPMGSLA